MVYTITTYSDYRVSIVDVIQSSLYAFIGSKTYALNNIIWNFTKMIMNGDKSILKSWLLCVNFEKFTSMNEDRDQSEFSVWSLAIGHGPRL